MEHFKNPDIRYKVPTQCGYEEVVKIEPFSEMVAKFDTGNPVLSVLHAEDIEVKGKKITFSINESIIEFFIPIIFLEPFVSAASEPQKFLCSFPGDND